LAELQALKPGNVHVFADGHNMVVDDFVKSAHAAAGVIAQPGLTVGRRVHCAVDATWQTVGCNTNLGIVLLASPLIASALSGKPLSDVLAGLTQEDAKDVFRAIVMASPAGLGDSEQHDVRDAPQVTLLETMRAAASRDRIAYQYANDYEDVLGFGLTRYFEAMSRWDNEPWAATAVHLGFMARFPDSHVQRKYGVAAAEALCAETQEYEQLLMACDNPKTAFAPLLRFDADLKHRRLNPGTSADLTVATLLAASLDKYLSLR
jgi:triphosphoribosyl-dephospho-CoA synthase